MPSPSPEHPGLFIRDPYRFSDAMLIIPPVLIGCLECFDGTRTDLDLRAALVQLTGDLSVGDIADHLINTLSTAGFLEDETFERMRQERISYWVLRFQLAMLGCMLCAMYGPEALRATAAIGFLACLAAAAVVGKFLP